MTWRRRNQDEQEQQLDAELRDHVERQVADYVAAGMTEHAARRRVRLEVGGLEQAKEACRDVRPRQWLDELTRDLRIGFRGLRRDRAFAVSAVVILAVGIASSVTMFSVLNAVVLRELPYAQPKELVFLTTQLMVQSRPDGTSMPNFVDWREQNRTFAGMTFYLRTAVSQVTFAGPDAPQRAQEGMVGPDFFELLGTPPLLGRTLSSEDFERRERVVVLSEGLWRELFGGAGSAVGRMMTIDGQDHVVVGVMPQTFQLPTRETRLWRPLSISAFWDRALPSRDSDLFEVIGRLKPGVGLDEARADMRVVGARLRSEYPVNDNLDVRLISLFDHVVGTRTRRGMWLAFAAVLALLVITCANVGGLLTVRSTRRRQEFDIRSALGAGRARLARQLLAESLSVWSVASAAGLLIAYASLRLLRTFGPQGIPRIEQIGLDAAAVAVPLFGCLAVVILFGTLPSIISVRSSSPSGIRAHATLPRHRLQDALVTGQVAGAMMLVVGAVLLIASFVRAQGEDPGYPAEELVIVRLELPQASYPESAHLAAFFREVQGHVTRLPGVVAAGAMTDFFLRRNADQRVVIEGLTIAPDEPLPRLSVEVVTPGFFRSVGVGLIEGRDFDERDAGPDAPRVVVVSESMARRFWPGESAVGKRMVPASRPRKDGSWNTIVGVVRDMRREGLDAPPILSAFVPGYQRLMDLTIRTSDTPADLIPAVRQEIRAIDASLPLTQISTAQGRLSDRLGGRRFEMQVIAVFAAVALLLAGAGLYALLAYLVATRTREIGIRSALGANRHAIISMVLRRGVRVTFAGLAIGVAGAAGFSRTFASVLYQIAPIDISSYLAAAIAILTVAALAAGVPALRAACIDPMTALREG
jgi:predicted permease